MAKWTDLFRELSEAQQAAMKTGEKEAMRRAMARIKRFLSEYQKQGFPSHDSEVPDNMEV